MYSVHVLAHELAYKTNKKDHIPYYACICINYITVRKNLSWIKLLIPP